MRLLRPSYEIITQIDTEDILGKVEKAARVCYKSESKIGPGTAEKLIASVIKRGHESVIEHENISVKFICDRGVTHEIVRHRLCSFSQESTRYCSYGGGVAFIIPPWIEDIEPGEYHSFTRTNGKSEEARTWFNAMLYAECVYKKMILELKWKPEQARAILPNSLKTEIVVTANLREWRHILKLRTDTAAHPQMREIMVPLRWELARKLPVIFTSLG